MNVSAYGESNERIDLWRGFWRESNERIVFRHENQRNASAYEGSLMNASAHKGNLMNVSSCEEFNERTGLGGNLLNASAHRESNETHRLARKIKETHLLTRGTSRKSNYKDGSPQQWTPQLCRSCCLHGQSVADKVTAAAVLLFPAVQKTKNRKPKDASWWWYPSIGNKTAVRSSFLQHIQPAAWVFTKNVIP